MKIAVYDTYVKKTDGLTAHFDIMVPEGKYSPEEVINFGKTYLLGIGEKDNAISAKECQLCHIEEPTEEMRKSIAEKGYFILKMDDIPGSLPDEPTRRQLIQHLRAISEAHRFSNFQGFADEEVGRLIERLS